MRPSRLAAAVVPLLAAACGGPTSPPPPPPPATIASITLSAASPTMAPGATQALTAVARNASGQPVSASFTWTSTEPGVATVNGSGMVTAVAPGTTAVTAASGAITSNAVGLSVEAVATPPARVEIDRAALLLPGIGQSATLTARAFDAQGAVTAATITWTSSAPGEVSVDPNGLVTGTQIGSAEIYATAGGVRSPAVIVYVAEPAAGALLVSDDQVVSVGPPLDLASEDTPAVGTEYEVRLRNLAAAPTAGATVLATGSAPVAGVVVGSRAESGDQVVRLAIAPLYRLFRDYDIDLVLDVAAPPAAGAGPAPAAPLVAFSCERTLESQLLGHPVSLDPTTSLKFRIEDRPGYSRHALEGSALIEGSAGLKLMVGFSASGKCEASVRFLLPVLGGLSLVAAPTLQLGLGASIDGHVNLATGTLGVTGKIGVSVEVGWECGGTAGECRVLDRFSPVNEFKTASDFPSDHGIDAEISAQFYVFAGIGAAAFGGLVTADFARIQAGPKQSFWLATEKDQAARADYRARYDLKLEGGLEPGSTLKKAIEKVFDGADVSIGATTSQLLAESPRGTLTASKALVRPNSPVEFVVVLDPGTLAYPLLGYNVTGLELYRKGEDEPDFTPWRPMDLVASNRASYTWTPTEADAGKYQFAAFVKTQIPTPLLEVADNSIVPVEVQCFSGLMALRAGTAAPVCRDEWTGTSSYRIKTPGQSASYVAATATITWEYDPAASAPGVTAYRASGTFDLEFGTPAAGCTITLSPRSFAIAANPLTTQNLWIYDTGAAPPTYTFLGSQMVTTTSTYSCPGKEDVVTHLDGLLVSFGQGGGTFAPGQSVLSGATDDGAIETAWHFARP